MVTLLTIAMGLRVECGSTVLLTFAGGDIPTQVVHGGTETTVTHSLLL